ncbi:MAG: zf-HC2 domain-containing protein [Candidatus Aminicenantes bacterium]|nr:zf-HC2 domain-containing protein [Candidatus Aminicenantes bacterium]
MKCLTVQQIYLYLEEELSPEKASKVKKHLVSCDKCRRALEERRLLHTASLSLPQWNVPPNFAEKTIEKIFPVEKRKFRWAPILATACSSLFLITVFSAVLQGQKLPAFLFGVLRTVWGFIEKTSLFAVKLIKVSVNLVKVLQRFLEMISQELSSLTGSLGTEIQVISISLTLILLFLTAFIFRRIFITGETK